MAVSVRYPQEAKRSTLEALHHAWVHGLMAQRNYSKQFEQDDLPVGKALADLCDIEH